MCYKWIGETSFLKSKNISSLMAKHHGTYKAKSYSLGRKRRGGRWSECHLSLVPIYRTSSILDKLDGKLDYFNHNVFSFLELNTPVQCFSLLGPAVKRGVGSRPESCLYKKLIKSYISRRRRYLIGSFGYESKLKSWSMPKDEIWVIMGLSFDLSSFLSFFLSLLFLKINAFIS